MNEESKKIRSDMVNDAMKLFIALMIDDFSLADFMRAQGFDNVIIYGMGKLGRYLQRYLSKRNINVSECFDSNEEVTFQDVDIVHRMDESRIMDKDSRIDAIIITSEFYYDEIVNDHKKVTDIPMVCFKDLLTEAVMAAGKSVVLS